MCRQHPAGVSEMERRQDAGGTLNPNSEAAAATPAGSTGDPPLGTGKAHEIFRASVSSANVLLIPSGQWPDGTGGSSVPPIPTSEFGFDRGALLNVQVENARAMRAHGLAAEAIHLFWR